MQQCLKPKNDDIQKLSGKKKGPDEHTTPQTTPDGCKMGKVPAESHRNYGNKTPYLTLFPGGSGGKESVCNTGDLGSIPELGRSLREGNCYPLPYSCLENSTDTGAWQATVHGEAKSWTRLSNFHFTSHKGVNRLSVLYKY